MPLLWTTSRPGPSALDGTAVVDEDVVEDLMGTRGGDIDVVVEVDAFGPDGDDMVVEVEPVEGADSSDAVHDPATSTSTVAASNTRSLTDVISVQVSHHH